MPNHQLGVSTQQTHYSYYLVTVVKGILVFAFYSCGDIIFFKKINNDVFIFREREREREEQGGAKGEEGGREMQLTYFTTWLNEDRLLMYILGFSVM